MIDLFLLTAPILLLGVVALLRFVGCTFTPQMIYPPHFTAAQPQVGAVALAWGEEASDPTELSYTLNRTTPVDGNTVQVGPLALTGTTPSETPAGLYISNNTYTDSGLNNGTTYNYTVAPVEGTNTFQASNPLIAIPVALLGRQKGSTFNAANPLAASLVGLFLMNDGTDLAQGTAATDINIVDGRTAIPTGGAPNQAPTWVVADPSIQFNGGASLNSYLNAGVDMSFNDMPTSMITIVAKVFIATIAQGGFCEKNDGKPPNSDSGFIFALTGNGAIHIKVECSTRSMVLETNANSVPTNRWIQVAFTWDGTQYDAATQIAPNSACSIFIDAQNQSGNINAANSHNGTGTLDTTKLSNSANFVIGNVSYDFAGAFNGKIAYLAVYNGRILNAADLANLDANLPINQPSFPS
jgi:hypothetical protein